MIQTAQTRICDVHRLVDYDCTPRVCNFCGLCSAWICVECAPDWPKRIKAFWRRKTEPDFLGDPEYGNKITEKGEWRG